MSQDWPDPEEPLPEEPQTTEDWLRKIEHNTGVIRAWVRFFGFLWIITTFIAIAMALSAPSRSPSFSPY